MSSLFYRDLKSKPQLAYYSATELIVDRRYFHYDDLSAGAGIICLGHSNEAIKEAMADQINTLPYVHAMNWTNEPAEELAEMLIRLTTRDDPHSKFHGGRVMFLNSGAEAVEAACKLAMQVGYEQGYSPWLFGRQFSYHGNTLFTLDLGDHPKKKLFPYVDRCRVSRFSAYRPTTEQGVDEALDRLRFALAVSGSMEQPIVVIEPIGGTTIGIEPSSTSYLEVLSGICDDNNATLVYDEVLCGNYRTGELFAYQYYNAPEPDVICLGKGLTGGYFPLSAVIVSRRLIEIIEAHSGKLWHSTTNQNHPIGCVAGIAALQEYERIKSELPAFGRQVQQLAIKQLSHAGCEVVGVGSLLGVRLDPDLPGLHLAVRQKALANGVVVYTDGGTIDGRGNMVLLAPPYSYRDDLNLDALEAALHRLALTIQSVMSVKAKV